MHARLVPHQSMEGKGGGRPRVPVRHIGAYRKTNFENGRREGRRPGNRRKNHQVQIGESNKTNKTARIVLSHWVPSSVPVLKMGARAPELPSRKGAAPKAPSLPRGLDSHCYPNCYRSRKSREAAGGGDTAECGKTALEGAFLFRLRYNSRIIKSPRLEAHNSMVLTSSQSCTTVINTV